MIERMTEGHIPETAEIERLCFSDPWSETALKESLDSKWSHFYVCTEGESVVGYMGLYAVASEGSVTNVAVHPDFRRRGVGLQLVENAVSLGKELGLEYITLEVRLTNESAQRLYEKCGFEKVGVRRNFYSDPKEDAVIMNYFYKE